jgi:hypothetical protein
MKEYYYSIKGMINNTKVNRQLAKKNFLATALTMSLLLILASSIVNLSIFEQAYAIKEFDVNVDIEDNEIKRGDTQHITVNVRNDDTDNEVSGANVKLTVYPPDSDSTSANDKTDKNGKATFDVDIDGNAETGTYDVEIKVSKDGYNTKTVNTSFDVVGSNSHDRNDNDHGNDDSNGGGNNDASSSSAAASVSSGSDSGNGAASGSSSSNNFSNEDNGDNEDGSSASSSSAAVGDAAAAAAASSGASSAAAAAAGSAAASAAAAGDDASSAASSAVSENGGSSSAAAAAASAAASASSSGNDNDDNDDSSSSSAASSTGGEDD